MKLYIFALFFFWGVANASVLFPQYSTEDYRNSDGVIGQSFCATFTNFEAQNSFSPRYSAKFCKIMLDHDPNPYCLLRATDNSRYYLPQLNPQVAAFISFPASGSKIKMDLRQVYCSGYGDNCVIASPQFACGDLLGGGPVVFRFSQDIYLASKDNLGENFQIDFPKVR